MVLFVALLVITGRALTPDGLAPFDSRFTGYSAEEARKYMAALARVQGTETYLGVFRALDTVFPVLLALTFLGAIWVNTGALGLPWRVLLVAAPALYLYTDLFENARVAQMLVAGPDVASGLVRKASTLTQVKWICVAASLATIVAAWGHRRVKGEG